MKMATKNRLINSKISLSIALILMILLTTITTGCGDDSAALVGRWTYESGAKDSSKAEKYFELFKDGTGVCDDVAMNWKIVDNKRLVFTASFVALTTNYEKSGSKLTLTYDDGKTAVFVKAK